MFKRRSLRSYLAGGVALAIVIFLFATCEGATSREACPTPEEGTTERQILDTARQSASFNLLYPCYLPNSQRVSGQAVVGFPGRQRTELTFRGPFDMVLRQSQVPPAVTPDPSGASRVSINLFDNTPATLIERNDGSPRAMYHLYWERGGVFFELQVFGPPQQRSTILRVARSLQ